jgi:hypothetical protein
VAFAGYSIPHPADNKVNIRVQTTGTGSSISSHFSFHFIIVILIHLWLKLRLLYECMVCFVFILLNGIKMCATIFFCFLRNVQQKKPLLSFFINNQEKKV